MEREIYKEIPSPLELLTKYIILEERMIAMEKKYEELIILLNTRGKR